MDISWIDPDSIAAGSIPVGVEDLEALHAEGVRAIVTLTEHPLSLQAAFTADLFAEMGITVLHVPVPNEKPPTREQAEQVWRFVSAMYEQKRPVYLHCATGGGRSGTMLHALYLLAGMEMASVKAKIASARPSSTFHHLSTVQRKFLDDLAAGSGDDPAAG